jgi:hypothetical protein
MRAPQILRDFFEWRWAPCVALTVGSLAYVGLAVLIIPSQIDGSAASANGATSLNSPPLPSTAFASSLTQTSFSPAPTMHEPMRRPPPPPVNNDPGTVRRGFSPPIEQPEAPPPPPPPAPVETAPTPPPPAAQPAPPPAEAPAATPLPPSPTPGDDSAQQQPQQQQQPATQ